MVYRIRYFRDGKLLDAYLRDKPLEDICKIAATELVEHHADYAAILDADDDDRLVEMLNA